MPVLLFPDTAYFLVKNFYPARNPLTGRINYYEAGLKWVKSDLHDPVQREHAHNYYLTLCPWISQADRDKVASDWADIRHAREAREAAAKKEAEEKKNAEAMKKAKEQKKVEAMKKAEETKKAQEKKKAEKKKKAEERKKADEKRKAEGKRKAEEMKKKKAEATKKAQDKYAQEQKSAAYKADKKRKFDTMLEDSEGVAMNIAKFEKKLKTAATKEKAAKTWMDVVMGD